MNQENNLQIAILLTVHNRKANTLKCLGHVFEQYIIDGHEIEVYLTNDGCTDGTFEEVFTNFPKVKIIKGDGNLFWNRGMNLAWKEAAKIDPDYYLWLNDDTFLFRNSLKELLASSFEKNNQAIIVGTTKSNITGLLTYGGRRESIDLIEPCVDLSECYHFNGNAILIPRSVFQKVGYLDNTFHHAIGDFDYGLRARKHNIKLIVSSAVNGLCERHDNFSKWCQPEKPFVERLKILYSSTCESNPRQIFIFRNRHYGFVRALSAMVSIHIRLFFPTIWNKKKVF